MVIAQRRESTPCQVTRRLTHITGPRSAAVAGTPGINIVTDFPDHVPDGVVHGPWGRAREQSLTPPPTGVANRFPVVTPAKQHGPGGSATTAPTAGCVRAGVSRYLVVYSLRRVPTVRPKVVPGPPVCLCFYFRCTLCGDARLPSIVPSYKWQPGYEGFYNLKLGRFYGF